MAKLAPDDFVPETPTGAKLHPDDFIPDAAPASVEEDGVLPTIKRVAKGALDFGTGVGKTLIGHQQAFQEHPIEYSKWLAKNGTDLDPTGLGGTTMRHAGNQMLLGFGDELNGLTGAFTEGVDQAFPKGASDFFAKHGERPRLEGPDSAWEKMMRRYREDRDQTRHDLEIGHNAFPGESDIASTAGGVASSVAATPSKLGLLGRLGNATVQGGGFGLGNSTADLVKKGADGQLDPDFKGAAKDTAVGAGSGALFQGAGEAAVPLASRLAPWLRNKSDSMALTAVGTNRGKIQNTLAEMGIRPDQQNMVGRQAMDNGLVKWDLNPFAESSQETAFNRSQAGKTQAGEDIGKVYEGYDARAAQPGGVPVDYVRTANASMPDLNTASKVAGSGKATEVGERILQQNEISPGSAVGLHGELSDRAGSVNYSASDSNPLTNRLHKTAIRQAKEDLKTQIAEQLGPAERAKLEALNRRYQNMAQVEELSGDAVQRDQQQTPFKTLTKTLNGLSSLAAAAGGAAAATGHNAIGLTMLTPYVLKQIVSRGPANVANFDRAAAAAVTALGPQANKVAVQAAIQRTADEVLRNSQDKVKPMGKLAEYFGGGN